MALLLILVFLVAPLVELAVIVQVAGSFGVLNTIGLLVLVSVLGAWLAKREGLGVLRRIQAAARPRAGAQHRGRRRRPRSCWPAP